MNFSVMSQFFWGGGCPKFPFVDNLAQKARTLRHYNKGVSAVFFEKNICVTKRPIFEQKKPKFWNSSYLLFLPVFFSFNKKKHQTLLKHLFL